MQAIQTATSEVSRAGSPIAAHIPSGGLNRSLPAALLGAGTVRRPPAGGPAAAERPERIVIEADEVTFRVGGATLSLTKENGGTLEIRAAHVRIQGDDILSEAAGTNTIAGDDIVAEAAVHADLLGKLIRIDGQCVKINS